ncbi:MAG TPA: hypothetical protein VHX60_18025 [Acidobacteriaceae bacterium]|nr:hypothetical protein [Acidobacteriaceae bacterium]
MSFVVPEVLQKLLDLGTAFFIAVLTTMRWRESFRQRRAAETNSLQRWVLDGNRGEIIPVPGAAAIVQEVVQKLRYLALGPIHA